MMIFFNGFRGFGQRGGEGGGRKFEGFPLRVLGLTDRGERGAKRARKREVKQGGGTLMAAEGGRKNHH